MWNKAYWLIWSFSIFYRKSLWSLMKMLFPWNFFLINIKFLRWPWSHNYTLSGEELCTTNTLCTCISASIFALFVVCQLFYIPYKIFCSYDDIWHMTFVNTVSKSPPIQGWIIFKGKAFSSNFKGFFCKILKNDQISVNVKGAKQPPNKKNLGPDWKLCA